MSLHLQRPGGRIAYDVTGDGPLAVCVPGMGELRSVFDALRSDLIAAGYRVARMDLRGHGDSDLGFDAYDDEAAASDAEALIEHLGGPAVVVGNSMGAGAGVLVAARRPDLVEKLVLVGPFVRNPPAGAVRRVLTSVLFRVLLARPWGPAAWGAYLKTAYPSRFPAEHVAQVRRALARPGRWAAFRATTRTSHAPAEKALDGVRARSLIVMGSKDPDWPDPVAEASWVRDRLGGELLVVDGAGHYPQAEFPEVVSPAVVEFLHA